MTVLRFLLNCILFFIIAVLLLLYFPWLPPYVKYSSFKVDPALPREGLLEKNFVLDDAERLFEGILRSPESIASRSQDELFVSLHNGSIVRIFGNNFENTEVFTTIGPGCAGPWEETICGRPLGLRMKGKDHLLVADAYLGLFEIDLKTRKKERLVDPDVAIEGIKPKLPDDLDVDEEGNIYWSDASTTATLTNGLIELMSNPSGRLLKYNPTTKECQVLLLGIHFANGVQLSPDQQFVLVSETFKHRVLRYWLKGPKAGSSEVFVSGLPGMPDNIRARLHGGYYVSLVTSRNPDVTDFYEVTSSMPGLRKFGMRLAALLQNTVELINLYWPNYFCANLSYKIFSLGVISSWIDYNETIVIEVDGEGKIVGSLQGSKGVVKMISETQQVGDYLFFGSPYASYLGRLHISKLQDRSTKKAPEKEHVSGKEEL